MSKDKSLGSSPIGFDNSSSNSDSFHFIPDLGVTKEADSTTANPFEPNQGKKEQEEKNKRTPSQNVDYRQENNGKGHLQKNGSSKSKKKPRKKIVSYYLEKSLIDAVKEEADKQGLYYSKLVSEALKQWLKFHA